MNSPSAARASSTTTTGGGGGSDDDDLADPKPWETRQQARHYGSVPTAHSVLFDSGSGGADQLPLYSSSTSDMETRQRKTAAGRNPVGAGADAAAQPLMGDYARFDEKEVEVEDDQGKWEKGYMAGPGIGGRRGLPPKQRIPGWVSRHILDSCDIGSSADSRVEGVLERARGDRVHRGVHPSEHVDAVLAHRSCKLRRLGRGQSVFNGHISA